MALLETKSGTDWANAYKVLLSVKLSIKAVSIKKNILLLVRLEKRGPRIDPWGIARKVSQKEQ